MNTKAIGSPSMEIPNNIVYDMFGKEMEVKEHKGFKFVIIDRKQISINKLPKFNDYDRKQFQEIFSQGNLP